MTPDAASQLICDLREGKITLPLIYALNNSNADDAEEMRQLIKNDNLSESDIDAAIKDAEKYAEEDEKRRKLVDAKNNAEQFAFVI